MEAAHFREFCSRRGRPFTASSAQRQSCSADGQVHKSGSPENEPLPVLLFGTRSSAQKLQRAMVEATACRGLRSRPIQVVATYSDGVLAICDPLRTEDSKPDQEVARKARGFFEKSLTIAGNMRREPGSSDLRNRMRWVQTFAEHCGIEHAVLTAPTEAAVEYERILCEAAKMFKHVLVVPHVEHDPIFVHSYSSKKNSLMLYITERMSVRKPGNAKKILDIASAISLAVLGFPFLLLVSLLICLDSPGPLLSRQLRIGKGNRVFTALKFRTTNATQPLPDRWHHDSALRQASATFHKPQRDPQTTRVGRLLRRFKLDELPQLWNILAGEMSFVGPQPIVALEINKYGPAYAAYERTKPGLTGLWQVSGRNGMTDRHRVCLDTWYMRNWSLCLDMLIILRSLPAVLSGLGRIN